jgi:hypothetical protein
LIDRASADLERVIATASCQRLICYNEATNATYERFLPLDGGWPGPKEMLLERKEKRICVPQPKVQFDVQLIDVSAFTTGNVGGGHLHRVVVLPLLAAVPG